MVTASTVIGTRIVYVHVCSCFICKTATDPRDVHDFWDGFVTWTCNDDYDHENDNNNADNS